MKIVLKLVSSLLRCLTFTVLLALFLIYALDRYVDYAAKERIYSDLQKIPHRKAALLLGTAKYVSKGKKNYFYVYRIRAAVALWKAGKVDAIVVSGDNASRYYNETLRMQKDLIKAGVPKKYIALDNSGFRTLDSIIRAEKVFALKNYIIISQPFHLERALFIAKVKGQDAIGFAAKQIKGTKAAKKMTNREYLARVKAFLDLYLLHTQPIFLDDRVKVNYRK